MASPYAIAAIGKAILSLLSSAVPKPEFSGAVFELYQSKDLQNPMQEGVSLYLHRITTSSNIRCLPPRRGFDKTVSPPREAVYVPSLAIDLHYLLVAWARDAFKQQRLLGWAMRVLDDTPVLHASLLNQPGPEPDIFGDTESVDLLLETISIADMGVIWDTAKHHMQPCAMYVVRQLALDSQVELIEADRVQTRVFDMGKVAQP